MDEAAYRLLSPDPSVNGVVRNAIQRKVSNISTNDHGNHMKGFYLEEIDYSNLACIEFLNKTLLPSFTSNSEDYKVIPLLNVVDSYVAYIKHNSTSWNFYYDLIDNLNAKTFMTVRYPFVGSINVENGRLKLPNNLNLSSLSFPSYFPDDIKADIQKCYDDGAEAVTNYDYNLDLQSRFETHEGYLKVFYQRCKDDHVNMYCVPQAIFWHFHNQKGWMREPMTSEISAQIGIDLCNGAKGILPYAYESWHSDSISEMQIHGGSQDQYKPGAQTNFHYDMSLGASDFDNTYNWGFRKRELDVYGENNVCHSRGSGNLGFSSRPI